MKRKKIRGWVDFADSSFRGSMDTLYIYNFHSIINSNSGQKQSISDHSSFDVIFDIYQCKRHWSEHSGLDFI